MNMFMEHIYNKKKFNFKAKIKYKRFIKSLQKTMPNFGTLWEMSQFIRILEVTCFYNNSGLNKDSSFLFSSTKYPINTDGFCVRTPELFIKYKLFEKDHRICIEIERLLGNNIKTNMEFSDLDNNVKLSISDSLILENVINITMDIVIKLLKKYYKARKI